MKPTPPPYQLSPDEYTIQTVKVYGEYGPVKVAGGRGRTAEEAKANVRWLMELANEDFERRQREEASQ